MSAELMIRKKMPKIPANITEDIARKTLNHPCYSADAHEYARMHLPVAPMCNIKCNYCNRKFDCVNESRPGVSSEILSPIEALKRYVEVKEQLDKLSVVGIAGPGDALANFENTFKTLRLIRTYDSKVTFCLSTNGLLLTEYLDDLIDLGVSHITVTINAVIPEIGAEIYSYIHYKNKTYYGIEAAKILMDKQLEGIEAASKAGIVVKTNTVVIKGINDQHVVEVIKTAMEKGAAISNLIPLIPVSGTKFEHRATVSDEELATIRSAGGLYLTQMYHCKQCRADAIGRLGNIGMKGHAGVCRRKNVG